MLRAYLGRGALAGAVGGAVFGIYTAVVVNPLVAVAEGFETGHHAAGHGAGEAALTAATGVGAGVAWGLFLGVAVFGVAHFLLEPALPGGDRTGSYLLGAAGFVTVSGAPWLALPPVPPGVEAALPTEPRLVVYAGMMAAGALACTLAVAAWRRTRSQGRATALGAGLVPLVGLLVLGVVLGPAPATGPVPDALVTAFRGVVVAGQALLWAALAAMHARLDAGSRTVEALAGRRRAVVPDPETRG